MHQLIAWEELLCILLENEPIPDKRIGMTLKWGIHEMKAECKKWDENGERWNENWKDMNTWSENGETWGEWGYMKQSSACNHEMGMEMGIHEMKMGTHEMKMGIHMKENEITLVGNETKWNSNEMEMGVCEIEMGTYETEMGIQM